MATDEPQSQAPLTIGKGGEVDLRAPFFRQLEVERGLTPGVVSGMAEKESGGNALKRATDPKSSAAGLFQITAGTARDWGLSPEDRFDPVKSAIAVADQLAARTRRYGIERAVGMHYGGPGSAWDEPVGSSGLSPAAYSGDVFKRAQKYVEEQPRVGYPSAAPAEAGAVAGRTVGQMFAAAPPAAPEYHEAPYQMRLPDGSVQSRVLRTNQPVTHGWMANYVQSQGGVYMGPPPPLVPEEPAEPEQPPRRLVLPATGQPGVPSEVVRMQAVSPTPQEPEAPPPGIAAPPPAAPPPPGVSALGAGYQLGGGAPLAYAVTPPMPAAPGPTPVPPPSPLAPVTGVLLPERSFASQVPSILGATAFGGTGAALGMPFGPVVATGAGMLGAGFGSGVGEATQIAGEKLTGGEPAEPGSAWKRVSNAAMRGATFEGLTAPVRYLPLLAASKAAPVIEAAEELRPILTGTAQAAAPAAEAAAPRGAAAALAAAERPGAKLPGWWATWSSGSPQQLIKAWNDLGPEGQQQLAGQHLPAMQTVMKTIEQGAEPWGKLAPSLSAGGVASALLSGHPYAALGAATPTAREVVTQGAPKLLSSALRTPEAVPWLLQLPKVGQVAEPLVSVPFRAGTQTVGAQRWPRTATMFPER
jgi:hypothetical protein